MVAKYHSKNKEIFFKFFLPMKIQKEKIYYQKWHTLAKLKIFFPLNAHMAKNWNPIFEIWLFNHLSIYLGPWLTNWHQKLLYVFHRAEEHHEIHEFFAPLCLFMFFILHHCMCDLKTIAENWVSKQSFFVSILTMA